MRGSVGISQYFVIMANLIQILLLEIVHLLFPIFGFPKIMGNLCICKVSSVHIPFNLSMKSSQNIPLKSCFNMKHYTLDLSLDIRVCSFLWKKFFLHFYRFWWRCNAQLYLDHDYDLCFLLSH